MNDRNRGFSLIEVLVALVILVVGLVGVFNLHTVSKRGSFESFQQTQAANYANDIVNRMKLNKDIVTTYTGSYSGKLSKPSKSCDVLAGVNTICTNVETRLWDLYSWEQLFMGASEKKGAILVGGLDSPTACIKVSGNGNVQVVVSWRGIRKVSDGAEGAAGLRSGDDATQIENCGKSTDRRRVYVVDTIIL